MEADVIKLAFLENEGNSDTKMAFTLRIVHNAATPQSEAKFVKLLIQRGGVNFRVNPIPIFCRKALVVVDYYCV